MENKTIKEIQEAQSKISQLLDGQSKEVIDALASVSATLDKAITNATERDKQYQEMKDDYIKMVKETKFSTPSHDDIEEDREVTLESIVKEFIK